MSQANVDIARRAFAAWVSGDVAGMLESLHSDLITTRPEIDLESFHGPKGLLQVIAEWTENFREFKATDEEYIDANDHQVIIRVRQSAIGAESGAPVVGEFWFLSTFEDGKIVRLDMYPREAPALEAAAQPRKGSENRGDQGRREDAGR
jgi:ketosteroid isomerase-like protein